MECTPLPDVYFVLRTSTGELAGNMCIYTREHCSISRCVGKLRLFRLPYAHICGPSHSITLNALSECVWLWWTVHSTCQLQTPLEQPRLSAHGGVHTYARDVWFTVWPVPILFVVFSSQIAQWRSSDQEFGQRAYWTENCSVRPKQPQEENEGVTWCTHRGWVLVGNEGWMGAGVEGGYPTLWWGWVWCTYVGGTGMRTLSLLSCSHILLYQFSMHYLNRH